MEPSKYVDDAEMVAALRADSPGAWETYMQRCGDTAVKLIGGMLAPAGFRDDIADVHLAALVKALSNWDGQRCAFRTWLVRLSRQLAINHLIKGKRRKEEFNLDLETVSAGAEPDVSHQVIDEEDRMARFEALEQGLQTLPPKYRRVVVMRYVCGIDDKLIARRLGIAESSVRVYSKRALETLRGTVPTN